MKAGRNKTIDLTVDEGREYLARCIKLAAPAQLSDILGRTINGDTFEVMPLLPRGFADLMIVDPPYNLDKDFGGSKFRKTSDEAYAEYTERWIELAKPLLKPNASVYVCCDWQCSAIIGLTLKRHFNVLNRITWQREKGRGARSNWKNSMEDIWFCTVSRDYYFNAEAVKLRRRVLAPYRTEGRPRDWEKTPSGNFRNTYPSNFWDDISVPYWSMRENTAHPTQKPEKLLAKLILASTAEGQVVFDPFLGSGSTSVTAKKLGRQFVGIEQNEQFCVWAEKRLELAEAQREIQGYTGGVFWERNTHAQQKRKSVK